jgi:mono/diheme cytochrome c family protein
MRYVLILTLTSVFLMGFSCDRHNPRGDWKKFDEEANTANAAVSKLNADGTIPGGSSLSTGDMASAKTAKPAEITMDQIKGKYTALCASCHGATGKGDGMALTPAPRNFTDKAWQGKVDDARIAKVIKSGGASVGLSPMMAPWSAALNDAEITAMVKFLRTFAQ